MKLIKAYVRTYMSNKVVEMLEKLDIHHLMAVHVEAIGHGMFKKQKHFDGDMGCECTDMIKIELVCPDEHAEKIKSVIIEKARTEYEGDGLVIISPIEEATSIRTGESIQ